MNARRSIEGLLERIEDDDQTLKMRAG